MTACMFNSGPKTHSLSLALEHFFSWHSQQEKSRETKHSLTAITARIEKSLQAKEYITKA